MTSEAARAFRAPSVRVRLAALVAPRRWVECAAVFTLSALATLHAEWRIVSQPNVFQTDSMIHEFWMRRFQDPALFHDPLTNALLATGYEPPGYRALYWVASHFLDPVFFGELLPLVLQPVAVLLLFWIVRDQVAWRPAAWIGAALFLVPWDILRFSGGHPRAFAHPIVLLTVLLLMRRRIVWSALVPAVGFLFYPPAAVVSLGIVVLAAADRHGRFFVDRRRALGAGVAILALGAAALFTRLLVGSTELLTADEARRYPEFGPRGQMHFFGSSSTLEYLRQNYSGFFLRDTGSILAVAAVGLLLVRPRNAKLLRWEVWCMAIVSLALFGVAQAVLFRLYLPHRYTYPLLPFFCIVIAVALRPTLEAWTTRTRLAMLAGLVVPLGAAAIALTVFPLGPSGSLDQFLDWLGSARSYLLVGVGVGLLLGVFAWARNGQGPRSLGASAALLAAALLCAEVAFAGGGQSPGADRCGDSRLYAYLKTLPADTIVAGDPTDLSCVPIAAERAVVISRKLYQPWDPAYLRIIRPRMFKSIQAYYGPSPDAVVQLRTLYGADYLVVRNQLRRGAWFRTAPFTGEVARLLGSGATRASQRMPRRCQTWEGKQFRVYNIACVESEQGA